jgi:hypothetical protein
MAGFSLKEGIIFVLIIWFLFLPFIAAIGIFVHISIALIIVLIILSIVSVFVFIEMAKWYKKVKSNLGILGFSLLAVNFGSILVFFTYALIFLLILIYVKLLPSVKYDYLYSTGWWGFTDFAPLILTDIIISFFSFIALWIYLRVKKIRLSNNKMEINS